jgi:hypothetical protein
MEWVQFDYMHIGPDRESSREKALHYLNHTYNMDFGGRVDRFASFGRAADIAERIQQFKDLGATHLIINPTCPPAEKHEQLERIASELLPLIR